MKQIIADMEKVKALADKAGLCPSPKYADMIDFEII